jgi:hypothetical protein
MLEVWFQSGVLHDHDLHVKFVNSEIFAKAGHADNCQVRFAGGVLLVEVQQDANADNVSMIKATYIFLNVGVVPLVTAFDGLLSMT